MAGNTEFRTADFGGRLTGDGGGSTTRPGRELRGREGGFTLLELMIVMVIALVLAAIAMPSLMTTVANVRLRNSAESVSGLLNQARLRAIKDNRYYTVRANGTNRAYIDIGGSGTVSDGSGNGSFDAGSSTVTPEPTIQLGGTSQFAQTGNPTFNTTTLLGLSSTITGDSALRISFNSRGLPCKMSGSVCATLNGSNPVSYVYFVTDLRASGWAAVSVSPAGRIKVWYYTGSGWR